MRCPTCTTEMSPQGCPWCGYRASLSTGNENLDGWHVQVTAAPTALPVPGARPRRVQGLGIAVLVVLMFNALVAALVGLVEFRLRSLWSAVQHNPGTVARGTIREVSQVYVGLSVASTVAIVSAGIVFIVWLWRVRRNAEAYNVARQRRRIGWVIGGWLCPIVNWWFPAQIVEDVWYGSMARSSTGKPSARAPRGHWLLYAWWVSWVFSWMAGNVALKLDFGMDTPEGMVSYFRASIIATSFTFVSALLCASVVYHIHRLQQQRTADLAAWFPQQPAPL